MSKQTIYNTEINDIREMLNVFNFPKMLSESQVFKLVEERSVWPAPYKQQIEKVINKYVGTSVSVTDKTYTISIPSSEWVFIKEIETLDVIVNLSEIKDSSNFSDWGSGLNRVKYNGKLTSNGKLDYALIIINGKYSESGKILLRTLYNNICHELHHLLNIQHDLLNSNQYSIVIDTNLYKKGVDVENAKQWINDNFTPYIAKFFNEMLYRLFNYSEINALVSGVYGDLLGLQSTRENFKEDVKKAQAYFIYKFFKDNYIDVIDKIDDTKIFELYKILNNLRLTINTNINTPTNCRYLLKRSVRHYLNRLINKIGGAASYYYDSIEEDKKLKEEKEKYKDKFITIE